MITALIIVTMLIGLPVLCIVDPAGHYDAEKRRREQEGKAS